VCLLLYIRSLFTIITLLRMYLYFILFYLFFLFFTIEWGYAFMDAENWIPANQLVTPNHIQPEWYFLFAYAILRSIPNKLGGVVGLLLSILVLFVFSLRGPSLLHIGCTYSPVGRLVFWFLVATFFLLTWLGRCPAESPYVEVALFSTIIYFLLFFYLFFVTNFRFR